MSEFRDNSIFWIEVEKVRPNPQQPRISFNEERLNSLADSIRQYGVLQPLVVTRIEEEKDEGGLRTYYELIAGERRLRASKLAGLTQVPALIRTGEDTTRAKLELAIIENLQREDLNPIDRARALERLAKEFGLNNAQIGRKVGKSREFVSNSLRMLTLPEEILQAVVNGKIHEGHTRPILMLRDTPDVQMTFFKDVMNYKMTVGEAERAARRYAQDKIRNRKYKSNPEITEMERTFSERLGTRVQIDQRDKGGRITIEYFSPEDLQSLIGMLERKQADMQGDSETTALEQKEDEIETEFEPKAEEVSVSAVEDSAREEEETKEVPESGENNENMTHEEEPTSAPTPAPKEDDDMYSVKNFSI